MSKLVFACTDGLESLCTEIFLFPAFDGDLKTVLIDAGGFSYDHHEEESDIPVEVDDFLSSETVQ